MNVWARSPLYRLWVIGGMVAVVAFAVIGGLSDPTNQDFVLYLIPVIGVYLAGILAMQWRALRQDQRERAAAQAPGAESSPDATTSLVWWSMRFAVILCVAIIAGVFLYYAGVDETLYPLGESGPGLPVALAPVVALALYGAVHTVWVLRGLFR